MKGKWIIALMKRISDGSITISEAIHFVLWRVYHTDEILMGGLTFPCADHITWSLITETFLHQEYTPTGLEIQANSFIVDIGAHRGTFVGFSARRTKGEIIAIEPDTENFAVLQQFIHQNQLKNVILRNCAVGAHDGRINIYRSLSSRHSTTGFDQITGQRLNESIEVDSISLNTLLKPYPQIDFLKLDCEGAEYTIIEGASDTSIKKIQRLSMEVHDLIDRKVEFDLLHTRLKGLFSIVSFQIKSNTLGIITAQNLRIEQ